MRTQDVHPSKFSRARNRKKKKNKMTHGAPSKKKSDSADDDVIPPPDGGWGWMVVFGSFMIHIVGNDF